MARNRADKRNIVIVILLLLLLVAIAVVVVGIFLTGRQNVNPFFKITYQARAVNAEVFATYRVEGSTYAKYFKSVEDTNSITFDASDEETVVKTLAMVEDIELEENVSQYVLFTYNFTNRNRARILRITMSDNALKQNVSVQYATSSEISGDNFEETISTIRALNHTNNNFYIDCPKATEELNPTVVFYALVSVVDVLTDASYETADATPFNFQLESIL